MSMFKRPMVWLWVVLTALSFWFYPRYELHLSVEMQKPADQLPSVYFSHHARGFSADNHRYLSGGVALNDGYRRYESVLRTRQPIGMLRIDPLIKPGEVRIRSFELRSIQSQIWSMAELLHAINAFQQISPPMLMPSGAELVLSSLGEDPYFSIKVDPAVYGENTWKQAGLVFATCALLWALILWVALQLQIFHKRHPWFWISIREALRRAGAVISDKGLIVFSPKVMLVVLVLLLTFTLGVVLKLSFSSLQVWDNHYKLESHEPFITWGEPKVIRSDEWYVHSPWVFSQSQRGLPIDNSNIGPPGAPLLVAAPVKHVSMVAQPKYWGFFFLDLDRAFAWYWMTKAIGLLLFGFCLFLVLTRNDVLLSMAGAIGLYSSSYLQWWFSAFTPEILTGFMASLLSAIYLTKGTRRSSVWAGAVVLPLSMVNLILHLYPAHIVPMAYLALFLLIPLVWISWTRGVVQPQLKTRLVAGGFSFVLFAALAYSVVSAAWPAIQSMMGTVYPGHRFSLGGGLGIEEVLLGFFEFWRDAYAYPEHGVNQSETARFLYLFPVGFLALAFYQYDKRLSALILAATLYSVLSLFWILGYFPSQVRLGLAHMGWSYVPGNRLYMGLGVASIIVLVLTCQLMGKTGPPTRLRTLMAWTIAPAFLTLSWFYLRGLDPAFYNGQRWLVSVLVIGGLVAAVVLGRRTWLLGLLLVAGWHNVQVNPLLSGTDTLLRKSLFTDGAQLAGGPNDKWAVFGDLKVAQGLRAQGQNVLNGIQYAPDRSVMTLFDPTHDHQTVWNRYANVGMWLSPNFQPVQFELKAPDLYLMKLHPCHSALQQAGVTHFAFANVGDPGAFECLKLLRAYRTVDAYFYERVR